MLNNVPIHKFLYVFFSWVLADAESIAVARMKIMTEGTDDYVAKLDLANYVFRSIEVF